MLTPIPARIPARNPRAKASSLTGAAPVGAGRSGWVSGGRQEGGGGWQV